MKPIVLALISVLFSVAAFGQKGVADANRTMDSDQRNSNEAQSVINVYSYLQCNQSWSANQMGACSSTICSEGCAMTCVAMLLKTNGVNVDPGQLNTWLTNNNGYDPNCNIDWGTAATYPGSTMTWPNLSYNFNLPTIKGEIDAGNPVIVSVFTLTNPTNHFVVVKGYTGSGTTMNDFVVADPLYSTDQNLASYTLDNGMRIFHDVTGLTSSTFCNNDYACSSAYPLVINQTCIVSSCSTIGATGPTTTVDAYCTTTGNCSAQYSSARWQDDVWFSITPPCNHPLTITVHPTSNLSAFDPDVFVYTYDCVPSIPTFTQQYCGCNGLQGQDEQLTFTPVAGTSYLIRVFSYGTNTTDEGDFTICVVDPIVCPTGIVENANTNNISIYPNPNNGKFVLNSKINNGEITIYNIFGETIFYSAVEQLIDSTIDISDQPNGMYFIEIRTEDGLFTKEIVIQN